MSTFESELKKGRFTVCHCERCDKITWPPNDSCRWCFGKISIRDVQNTGTIIECSAKDGKKFCIGEFEGAIRIMGTVTGPDPSPGQKIRIISCSFDNEPRFAFSVN